MSVFLFGCALVGYSMWDCWKYGGEMFMFNMPMPRMLFHSANVSAGIFFIHAGAVLALMATL